MILKTVNVSTGPVKISDKVHRALTAPSISHRSADFKQLYQNTSKLLSELFNVKETLILTGSGTLANEAMLCQIKTLNGKGLILSNGEFGTRLIEKAKRHSLDFKEYTTPWGEIFDIEVIKNLFRETSFKWLLFCHCETSTGVVNNLNELVNLSTFFDCYSFVDCMSTVGTYTLDLSKVAMATASSGKGLGSLPGLSIVFSNITVQTSSDIPCYFDLGNYASKDGILYTVSSNLVNALHASICQKLSFDHFKLINQYCQEYYNILNHFDIIPFNNSSSRVFTLILPRDKIDFFITKVKEHNLVLSYESEYLKKRNWCQIATFGFYNECQLEYVSKVLLQVCSSAFKR